MPKKEMPSAWGRGFELKKELKEEKTSASLLFNARREIEEKKQSNLFWEHREMFLKQCKRKMKSGAIMLHLNF